jgi:nicotinamidase-related amidase
VSRSALIVVDMINGYDFPEADRIAALAQDAWRPTSPRREAELVLDRLDLAQPADVTLLAGELGG